MDRATTEWQLLQISDALDLEFASALAESVPVQGWEPHRTYFPIRSRNNSVSRDVAPSFRIRKFSLLRGYATYPLSLIARTGPNVLKQMLPHVPDRHSPLICTVPYFAPVAELWPGPVVYWLTDLIDKYESASGKDIPDLDRRMCAAATLVCPNSQRIGNYLVESASCSPGKIVVIPNAVRAVNLYDQPAIYPAPLPADLRLPRGKPVIGVLGNQAGNIDWLLVREAMRQTLDLSWLFVGPYTMTIADQVYSQARKDVMSLPNAHFVGARPHAALGSYARALDVAVMPYRKLEPTYSGSSTRFYEHLAACRPMIATRGFEELTHKEPLLKLVATAAEMVHHLRQLQSQNFNDGHQVLRWNASRNATWRVRADTVREALDQKLSPTRDLPSIHMQAA